MIESLDDAWKWYDAVKTLADDMKRLAKLWDDPTLIPVLARDNRLRDRIAADLTSKVGTVEADLDHLEVLVFFTAFEATVRSLASADVDRETALLRHPAVLRAVKDLKEAIENGSFGRVTDAYKQMNVHLTAQVNQVRKFRNWVAHGRRDAPENNVEPKEAIDRLRQYLDLLATVDATASDSGSPDAAPPDTTTEPDVSSED